MKAGASAAPAPRLIRLGVVESTQRVAFELGGEGAPDGTAVVADHQTRGRGRRGRVWHDEAGASLLLSVLWRPRLPVHGLPLLSFAAAVAVAEALSETTALDARLEWPNDVLVRGRKIAGILLEARPEDGRAAGPVVVVGVGVNLRQAGFPRALEGIATSVLLETGRAPDPERLLQALLGGLSGWRRRLEEEGFDPVRTRWLQLADLIGRHVTVDGQAGVAVDLDGDGALVVREGAALRRIVAGEVGSPARGR